jgi:putative transposase
VRIGFSGGLFHTTSHGDRREAILEDEDRQRFLGVPAELVERYHWACHGRYGSCRTASYGPELVK